MKRVTPCRGCKQPVIFAVAAGEDHHWVCLNAAPVMGLLMDSNRCWVVAETTAHRARDLEETLQVRRQVTDTEARQIAREDFAWHTQHDCPNRPKEDDK